MDILYAFLVGVGLGVLVVFDAWCSAKINRRLPDPRLRHPEFLRTRGR